MGGLFPCMLTLLLWGLWGFCYKLSVERLPATVVLLMASVGGLVVAGALFATTSQRLVLSPYLMLAFVAGLIGNLGTFFFIKALESQKLSIVVPLTALYPLVSLVLAAIFMGERLQLRHWLGAILATFAGALLVF